MAPAKVLPIMHRHTVPATGDDSLDVAGIPALARQAADVTPLGASVSASAQRQSRTVPVQSLTSDAPVLVRPLYVVVEESASGKFSAVSYDLELAGEGDTDFDALDDLRSQIGELFLALSEMRSDLPEHLALKLRVLEALAR